MKRYITIMLVLFLFHMLSGAVDSDAIPVQSNVKYTQSPQIEKPDKDTVLGDVIFEMDVQTICGDDQLLGIEFDGTYFYITGGNNNTDPNKVYVVDTSGILIWTLDQPVGSSWGWRDLVWDGVYAGGDRIDTLYASVVDTNVDKFGINLTTGVLDYYGNFTGPVSPNRALAYKPDSAWFFTASFRNPCYKFSRTNPSIQQVSNSLAMYGAAYDTDPVEGGWIWWHSQDDPGTNYRCQITQMDAITMNWTGLSFGFIPPSLPPMPGDTSMAGGLCFYEDFRSMDVLFALVQGDPVDEIVGVFVRSHGIAEWIDKPTEFMFSAPTISRQGRVDCEIRLPHATHIDLSVYSVTGSLYETVISDRLSSGTHVLSNDVDLPTGVYFFNLKTGSGIATTKKVLVVK
jgi:hypothetical protein